MKHLRPILLLAASLALPLAASATPIIIQADSQTVKAIQGLVVNGSTYNVTFTWQQVDSTFSGNAAGATAAANAIADLLTGTPYAYVSTPDGGKVYFNVLNGPGDTYGAFVSSFGIPGYWRPLGDDYSYSHALFAQVAQTPEPSSLGLLGSGALALCGAARRRMAQQQNAVGC